MAVPVPAAYSHNISYDYTQGTGIAHAPADASWTSKLKRDTVNYDVAELDTRSMKDSLEGGGRCPGNRQISVLMLIRASRLYIRALAIAIMIVSLSLVLGAVIMFERAHSVPGRPLDYVPQPTPITDYPCRVFTGIASMNVGLSITIFSLSCISGKVRAQ